MSFWGPILGRRWGSAVFVIAGEEVGFDEISFANFIGGETLWKTNYVRFERRTAFALETAPAAGGGAAGAVLVVNPREEVKADRFRQGRGGGRPWRNSG